MKCGTILQGDSVKLSEKYRDKKQTLYRTWMENRRRK